MRNAGCGTLKQLEAVDASGPTVGILAQQTVERAGVLNAIRRKRFVWRSGSFICILAHTVPELRGGDEPAAQIDFFSGSA